MNYYQVQLTTDQALQLRKKSRAHFKYTAPFFYIRVDFLLGSSVIISWALILGGETEQKIYLCGGDSCKSFWREVCTADQLSALIPIDYDFNQRGIYEGGGI